MAKVLALARHTNMVWLQGWGCEVRDWGFCVTVRNPDFAEYNAIVDLKQAGFLDRALELVESEFAQSPARPTIYLSAEAAFESARSSLAHAGYHPVTRTQRLVARNGQFLSSTRTGMRLIPTTADSLSQWILLYQENYGIVPRDSAANVRRWTRLFSDVPAVHFFLIEAAGDVAGTVQLVATGNGCCGIYGLSMRRSLHSLFTLRALYRELLAKFIELGAEWLCFERLRPITRRSEAASRPSQKRIRWQDIDWEVLALEWGYRRDGE